MTVKDWLRNAKPITTECRKKLDNTIAIETNFNKEYIEAGILAFLSGFGAKVIIMIKLIILATQSAEFDKVTNVGKVVLNKVVTMLHAKAVFK